MIRAFVARVRRTPVRLRGRTYPLDEAALWVAAAALSGVAREIHAQLAQAAMHLSLHAAGMADRRERRSAVCHAVFEPDCPGAPLSWPAGQDPPDVYEYIAVDAHGTGASVRRYRRAEQLDAYRWRYRLESTDRLR